MPDIDFEDEKSYNQNPEIQNNNADKTSKPLIYVGPNIPKLGMERYTVYKGELPSSVDLAISKIPELKYMLIPVDEMINFTGKLLNPSSPERKYNTIIQRKMQNL